MVVAILLFSVKFSQPASAEQSFCEIQVDVLASLLIVCVQISYGEVTDSICKMNEARR